MTCQLKHWAGSIHRPLPPGGPLLRKGGRGKEKSWLMHFMCLMFFSCGEEMGGGERKEQTLKECFSTRTAKRKTPTALWVSFPQPFSWLRAPNDNRPRHLSLVARCLARSTNHWRTNVLLFQSAHFQSTPAPEIAIGSVCPNTAAASEYTALRSTTAGAGHLSWPSI